MLKVGAMALPRSLVLSLATSDELRKFWMVWRVCSFRCSGRLSQTRWMKLREVWSCHTSLIVLCTASTCIVVRFLMLNMYLGQLVLIVVVLKVMAVEDQTRLSRSVLACISVML